MKKKIIAVLLSGAMAVGLLAGCGASGGDKETGKAAGAAKDTQAGSEANQGEESKKMSRRMVKRKQAVEKM